MKMKQARVVFADKQGAVISFPRGVRLSFCCPLNHRALWRNTHPATEQDDYHSCMNKLIGVSWKTKLVAKKAALAAIKGARERVERRIKRKIGTRRQYVLDI